MISLPLLISVLSFLEADILGFKDYSWIAMHQATTEDIEQAFWDVVEAGEEPTEVMYGADLDTSVLGSAFHTRNRDGTLPLDEKDGHYAACPWNLNNLPSLGDSLLKHLDDSIAGVTLPWMYMGMMFSSFCWHIEDHMFYSSEHYPPRQTFILTTPPDPMYQPETTN